MPTPAPPLVFDRKRLRKRRDRAAAGFDAFGFLKERTCADLLERLADTPRRFGRALDLCSHTGGLSRALAASGKVDHATVMDVSIEMVRRAGGSGGSALVGDVEALPFADGAFDLVASTLGLHWANDLPGALIQIRRCLKADGLFLGALFGAGTLTELRQSLLAAESELTGGAAARISPLPGLQDMAGLLQRAGFALPVADIDHVTVRYDTPFDLLADLKGMGERAAFAESPPRGLSRRILTRMTETYADRFSDPDGRIRASFEIIWLSGWAPDPAQPKGLRPGSAKASLADAVGGVRKAD